jgi:enamine deaminase RidA (YjgF/YER057c/UK114 family)
MTIQRINPMPRWSDVTIFNSMAYFVEVPEDTSVDMQKQVTQVLQQAEITLAKANSDKSRLLSAMIYIADLAQLAVLNDAWEAWLPEGCAPSRACLKVELVNPEMLVEIAFVAALNN